MVADLSEGLSPAETIVDDGLSWDDFIRTYFSPYVSDDAGEPIPFAEHHEHLWEWVFSIERGKRSHPYVGIWPRGGAKSTNAEMACVAVGARQARRYVIYVCETQDQADDHVENIASMLENPALETRHPELTQRKMGKYGNSKGWRRNRLRTAAGLTVDAMGLDSASRGAKVDEDRPDLICHEVGTPIRDHGKRMLVEDHPGLLGYNSQVGLHVEIWGMPEAETVTPEHRYWARSFRVRHGKPQSPDEPGWVEARCLRVGVKRPYDPGHWLGMPINQDVCDFEPVSVYRPGSAERDSATGRMTGGGGTWISEIPTEFSDPEWWWFFGLWWGDGHVAGKYQAGVTVANTQPEIAERVTRLLSRYGVAHSTVEKSGCHQIIFSMAWLNRWLRTWKLGGNAMKCPPEWVEQIAHEHQSALVRGYIDADGHVKSSGSGAEVRVTSVSLQGLAAMRRILARLGIAASIRKGAAPREQFFAATDRTHLSAQKYDLRFRDGAENIGLDIERSSRYKYGRQFIDNGYLWSKVRAVYETDGPRTFAPITTDSHTYETDFGLSHNCLDDIDGELDSPAITQKKIKMITRKLLPAGSDDLTVLAVQNLVHTDSVFARLAGIAPSGRAKFLSDRVVSGPIPAIHDFSYAEEDGVVEITGGTPSWEGQGLERCQEIVSDIGIDAFLAECQHEVTDPEDAIFTRELFQRFEGANAAHRHASIERFIAIDTGFKEGHHNDPSAWCVADLSSDYRLKVMEVGAQRLAFPDLLERVDDLAMRHSQDGKLTAVVFEDVGAGTSALQALGAGSWLAPYLHPFKPQGKKTERARAAAMWARRGCVLLPDDNGEMPWLEAFQQQLFRFPNVAHDDMVDAMVMLTLFSRDILAEGLRFRQSSGAVA